MGKQKKEIIDNMEFLMKELHKEWDRTGAAKASVFISLDDVEEVHKKILLRITKQQHEAETGNISFKKSVRLSKECYVLLRLIRKIKTEEHKTCGDVPRIELFARSRADGWDSLGNEIDGKDIRDAIYEYNTA